MAYQFKIQLKGVTNPPVWRRIVVPQKITFHDFHEVIQIAFGWFNDHMYQFCPKGYGSHPVITLPSDDGWIQPDKHAARSRLDKVFTHEKQKIVYIYDFGDDWVHHIVLEKILPDEVKVSTCVAGKGTCPPEDCGGPWGYENLKTILADHTHEEHGDMKEWLGMVEEEVWDADWFEKEEVNANLQQYHQPVY